ncbi:MAG: epoxide hydrolase [Novosphingobium sp.]|nr:epoxide hydrolase [Novosphingobium sp.]
MRPQPFTIDIPVSAIENLKSRIRATAWPDDLDNGDWNYGFPRGYLKSLAESWAEDYDWYDAQARMNAYPHFKVTVDDVPIHFMRVAGKGPDPVPLILSHGWPWTFWDMQRVIGPLTDPAAFGGDPADAFELIVPSLPGFAFSTPLRRAGMNFWKTADLWQKLMTQVLGFDRYAAAGGDWGQFITQQLGHKYAESLLGIMLTGTAPLALFNAPRFWDISSGFLPADLPEEAQRPLLDHFRKRVPHVAVQTIEPQTLAYAMHDSPVGLLAWLVQPRRDWGECGGDPETAFPREHLLTTATIYWLTGSYVNSARFYADAVRSPWAPSHSREPLVEAPTAITFLGGEFLPGMTTANRLDAFHRSPWSIQYNLHFTGVHEKGGHFSFYEAPDACVHDLRAHFRPLRA